MLMSKLSSALSKMLHCLLGANFVKSHPNFSECFPVWSLYEAARSCHHFAAKKPGFLNQWVREMQASCDFLSPRLSSSVALQTIYHCWNAISTTLYEGVQEEDMVILLLEVASMCVSCLFDFAYALQLTFSTQTGLPT